MTQEFIVSTLDDENDGDFSEGNLSLREAIALANDTEGEDTITFDSALSGGTITLIKDQPTNTAELANISLSITDSVTISGLGADNLTIDGDNGGNGIFEIDNGAEQIDVTVEDLTIANGAQLAFSPSPNSLTERGGAFFVGDNASLLLSNSIITGSSASVGGAIYNRGTTDIVGSTIKENSGSGDGAAPRPARTNGIIANGGELNITNSTIENNDGTAIFNNGTTRVTDSNINNNTSIYGGGAIDNRSVVTITNSNLSGNSAPFGSAIRNTGSLSNRDGGSLYIEDSTISQNISTSSDNSAIITNGTATITNSTISDHSGGSNVGIVVESGELWLQDSTVSENQADQAQSGIIINPETTTSIINSTIANNQARSNAGIENFGTVNVTNSTIANNSGGLGAGGLRNFGTATVTSTILAENTGGPLIGDVSGDGEFISGGNNLIGNGDDGSSFVDGVNGDLVGTNGDDPENPDNDGLINSQLGELRDNGGTTPTIALLDGSPAIDAGSNPSNLEFDQRGEGFDRTVGEATDIGAFEVQDSVNPPIAADLVVSTLDDENDGDFSEGDLSLREAIALASVSEGADTITFDSALSGGTIALDSALSNELIIGDSVSIIGLGQDNLTLNGAFVVKLPEFDAELNIDGLNLVGGTIDSYGELNITDTTISQSLAIDGSSDNSSIITRGTLNLSNSNIIDSSGGDDLGILIESGTANIADSTIANHEGVLGGSGVLILTDEIVNITNSTIGNNNNRFVGGVANAGEGTVNITNTTIADNNGGLGNGGIQNSSGTVILESTIVADNRGAGIGDVAGDGEYVSNGNNLIGNGDDAEAFINDVNGDIVGTNGDDPANPDNSGLIDPQLGELQNNGGSTLTFALSEDSPAVDTGSNPNNLEFDQRGEGFDRTIGEATDIGAFELQDTDEPNLIEDHIFNGTDGDDSFDGSAGNDLIFGGEGNDFLNGGSGDDDIFGGEGQDTLIGGSGDDTLSGNDGSDLFILESGDSFDNIVDFVDGSDLLELPANLTFDDLNIISNAANSGVLILDTSNHNAVLASIDNVHVADINAHDFTNA